MVVSEKIVSPLLKWYQENARLLPWRLSSTPYHIWVSEIMLQQTRVEAVISYYLRFIEVLPTVVDLANIEEERLLKLWEGLGYYSRIRNMQKAAKIVCETYDGKLPETYNELIELPGIGAYTAGAIAAIAYQKRVAAIDGNVLRVMSRLCADATCIDLEPTKKDWKQALEKIMPDAPGLFNQSLMELGATVCIPNGKPQCERCPLQDFCKAYQKEEQLRYPVRKEKTKREIEKKTVFLMIKNDAVALQKRDTTGLLAGFYEFPNQEGHLSREEAESYLKENNVSYHKLEQGSSAKHIFTHKEWHMESYIVWISKPVPNFMFSTGKQLNEQYPIPGAFQKYRKLVENLWKETIFLNYPQEREERLQWRKRQT